MMESNTMAGFSDVAVKEDGLGAGEYYEGLAEFVLSCPTPMTIAVQGGWGTGKSSAMKIIEECIKEKACVVSFNSWKYSKTSAESLIIPLLREFEKKITDYAIEKNIEEYKKEYVREDNAFSKLLAGAAGALYYTGRGVVEYLATKVGASNTADNVMNDTVKSLLNSQAEMLSLYESLDALHEGLEKRINLLCSKIESNRIVIFIDDLDRIVPEDAVNLLEDMKNIMDFKNCVFVLALDNGIVQRGLRKKYGNDIKSEDAEKFFDKLIQLPFNLPIYRYKIDEYIRSLNAEHVIGDDSEALEIAELLECAGIVNPRTIKRMLNILSLYRITGKESSVSTSKLFATIILQSEYRKTYDNIIRLIKDKELYDVKTILERGGYENFWGEIKGCSDESGQNLEKLIEKITELFGRNNGEFVDCIMQTAITGKGEIFDRKIVTQKMESILLDYINDLFGDWKPYEFQRGWIDNNDDRIVYVSVPTKAEDHVNLVIKSKNHSFGNVDDLRTSVKEYTGLEVYEDYNDRGEVGTEMILQDAGCLTMRNIIPNQLDYIKFAGEFLRTFKSKVGFLPTPLPPGH